MNHLRVIKNPNLKAGVFKSYIVKLKLNKFITYLRAVISYALVCVHDE